MAASRRGGDRARRVVRRGASSTRTCRQREYAVEKDAEGLAEISGWMTAELGTQMSYMCATVDARAHALSPLSSPFAFPDQSKFTSNSSSFGAYFFCSFFHSFRSLPLYFRSSSGISPTLDGLFSS